MFVKRILEYDAFSQKADIIISDNTYEVLWYHHPTDDNILGTEVKEIVSLFATDIIRSNSNERFINKALQPYSYLICGQVIDIIRP